MFTGIIECMGTVISVARSGSNISFWIESPVSKELKVDQSVSHNGVCLTVEALDGDRHKVTAIEETLEKTDLATWREGSLVNIERCMVMNGRLDGHIVQGHVDCTAICVERKELDGSWEYTFRFPENFAALVIEKGSVSVNGASLTCFNVTRNHFSVAIIPYTYEHTSIRELIAGSIVNVEFDILGKYIQRKLQVG